MKPELRKKIIAYNKAVAAKGEKASDLERLITKLLELPPGQLKKVLDDETCAILEKYGVEV